MTKTGHQKFWSMKRNFFKMLLGKYVLDLLEHDVSEIGECFIGSGGMDTPVEWGVIC